MVEQLDAATVADFLESLEEECGWCGGKGTVEGEGYPPRIHPCSGCAGTKKQLTEEGHRIAGFIGRVICRRDGRE